MRRLTGIVEGNVAPSINMLWVHNKEIKYFKQGKWETIGTIPAPKPEEKVPDVYSEYTKQGGTKTLSEFAKELVELIG
jgi:hypothetical protein